MLNFFNFAAFVTTTFSNPVWMVRTRLQLDHKWVW